MKEIPGLRLKRVLMWIIVPQEQEHPVLIGTCLKHTGENFSGRWKLTILGEYITTNTFLEDQVNKL